MRRPAYFSQRYEQLWLRARIRAVFEPLSVFAVIVWLTYGARGEVVPAHKTEATIFGVLLAINFVLAVASLVVGLWLNGGGWEIPPRVTWFWLQKIEILPTLLNAAILTHWTRLIGRHLATPVWALLYEMGFAASILHVLDPLHAFVLQIIIVAHHCAVLAWEVVRDSDGDSLTPAHADILVWFDSVYTVALEIFTVDIVVLFIGATQIEWMRREDWKVKGRAMLRRNVLAQLVSNFFPVRRVSDNGRFRVSDNGRFGEKGPPQAR